MSIIIIIIMILMMMTPTGYGRLVGGSDDAPLLAPPLQLQHL